MLLRFPIQYTLSVLEPRKRNRTDLKVGEWVEADIPELTNENAPVALRWKNPDERPFIARSHSQLNAEGEVVEVRWFDGSLWMPSREYENRDIDGAKVIRAADIQELLNTGRCHNLPFRGLVDWQMREVIEGTVNPIIEEAYRDIDWSGREQKLETLDRSVRSFFILDGDLWEKVREPVYDVGQAKKYDTREALYIPLSFAPFWDHRDDQGGGVNFQKAWRIDRHADMMAANMSDIFKIVSPEVEVFIPECVQYRDEELALRRAAEHEVKGFRGMENWPMSRGVAYYEMRDALREMESAEEDGEEITNAMFERLAMHLTDYIITQNGNPHSSSTSVCRRWADRPLEMGDYPSLAM